MCLTHTHALHLHELFHLPSVLFPLLVLPPFLVCSFTQSVAARVCVCTRCTNQLPHQTWKSLFLFTDCKQPCPYLPNLQHRNKKALLRLSRRAKDLTLGACMRRRIGRGTSHSSARLILSLSPSLSLAIAASRARVTHQYLTGYGYGLLYDPPSQPPPPPPLHPLFTTPLLLFH